MAFVMTSPSVTTVTSMGAPTDPSQVYNPAVLNNAAYAGNLQLPSSTTLATCLNTTMAKTTRGGTTGGSTPASTTLQWNVNAGLGTQAQCANTLNNLLRRPMYVRVLLSPAGAAALQQSGATLAPTAQGASYAALSGNASVGGALTWGLLPYWGNLLSLSATAPGQLAVNDVCAQNVLPGQPADTCVVQIVSGGNSTVWTGLAGVTGTGLSPFPPLPPVSAPPPQGSGGGSSGLTYNEKLAIVICSVVGGILLILLCCLLGIWCYRRRQRKWAPAKSAVYTPEEEAAAAAAAAAAAGAGGAAATASSLSGRQGTSTSPGPDSQFSAEPDSALAATGGAAAAASATGGAGVPPAAAEAGASAAAGSSSVAAAGASSSSAAAAPPQPEIQSAASQSKPSKSGASRPGGKGGTL